MAVTRTRTRQCRYCETAIEQNDQGLWVHIWNQGTQCRKMSTRVLMESFAAPRPAK